MSRILVIDDSAVQRMLARTLLEEADFEVVDASDGQAGLLRAQEEPVDCILLDWLMPETSGRDVLLAFQEQGNDVPIIVVTGDPSDDTREECSRLGATAVIDKIQNPVELVQAVASVLRPGDA